MGRSMTVVNQRARLCDGKSGIDSDDSRSHGQSMRRIELGEWEKGRFQSAKSKDRSLTCMVVNSLKPKITDQYQS